MKTSSSVSDRTTNVSRKKGTRDKKSPSKGNSSHKAVPAGGVKGRSANGRGERILDPKLVKVVGDNMVIYGD